MPETSFAGLLGEMVAVVSQQLYADRFRISFSGSSHFGMDSCTDGPDAAETIVSSDACGRADAVQFAGKVHDATVSTPSALSRLHLTVTNVNQLYIIIKSSPYKHAVRNYKVPAIVFAGMQQSTDCICKQLSVDLSQYTQYYFTRAHSHEIGQQ